MDIVSLLLSILAISTQKTEAVKQLHLTTHSWVLVRIVSTVVVKVTAPPQGDTALVGTVKVTYKCADAWRECVLLVNYTKLFLKCPKDK